MQILNNFGIQPILLLAQIVNFAIILYLLKRFFYKPIVKVLEDRKKKIEESLQNAAEIEEKLQKTEEKSAQILEDTRTSAQNLIADAKKESERIYEAAAQDARKMTEDQIKKAQGEIERLKQDMQKQLEQDTLTLVATVVKKVLARNLKPKEREELTSKAAAEIERQIQ